MVTDKEIDYRAKITELLGKIKKQESLKKIYRFVKYIHIYVEN